MKNEKFSIFKRLKSFKYAFNGLKFLFQNEHNARIHLLATFFVVTIGFYFHFNLYEWIAIIFAICFVFVTEILNSAIENLADIISPHYNEKIKIAKDLSAAAVLLSAIVAIIVGLFILLPRFLY